MRENMEKVGEAGKKGGRTNRGLFLTKFACSSMIATYEKSTALNKQSHNNGHKSQRNCRIVANDILGH